MSIVLDASMTLAWLFERPTLDQVELANKALDELGKSDCVVPPVWRLEVLNALLVAERRGVIDESQTTMFLSRLSGLPIEAVSMEFDETGDTLLTLARRYSLSSYDASYLDLAVRTGARLATFDRKLANAAQVAGVTLFSVRSSNE